MAVYSSDNFDDYGVEGGNEGQMPTDLNAAAIAAALSAANIEPVKKKARKPLPKLDFERCSILCEADLAMVMRVYKEWADYMFPKIPFKDVSRRIDRLSHTHRTLRMYIRALTEAQASGAEFDETVFLTGLALGEAAQMVEDE